MSSDEQSPQISAEVSPDSLIDPAASPTSIQNPNSSFYGSVEYHGPVPNQLRPVRSTNYAELIAARGAHPVTVTSAEQNARPSTADPQRANPPVPGNPPMPGNPSAVGRGFPLALRPGMTPEQQRQVFLARNSFYMQKRRMENMPNRQGFMTSQFANPATGLATVVPGRPQIVGMPMSTQANMQAQRMLMQQRMNQNSTIMQFAQANPGYGSAGQWSPNSTSRVMVRDQTMNLPQAASISVTNGVGTAMVNEGRGSKVRYFRNRTINGYTPAELAKVPTKRGRPKKVEIPSTSSDEEDFVPRNTKSWTSSSGMSLRKKTKVRYDDDDEDFMGDDFDTYVPTPTPDFTEHRSSRSCRRRTQNYAKYLQDDDDDDDADFLVEAPKTPEPEEEEPEEKVIVEKILSHRVHTLVEGGRREVVEEIEVTDDEADVKEEAETKEGADAEIKEEAEVKEVEVKTAEADDDRMDTKMTEEAPAKKTKIIKNVVVVDEPETTRKVVQFFVKYRDTAYIHCAWDNYEDIVLREKQFGAGKIKRYFKNLGYIIKNEQDVIDANIPAISHKARERLGSIDMSAGGNAEIDLDSEDEDGMYFPVEYKSVDRIIARRTVEDADGTQKQQYLVKWCELSYTEATWEYPEDFNDDEKIKEYERFHILPTEPPRAPVPRRLWVRHDHSPAYKNDNTLRPYQLDGLNWLIWCWCQGRSSILADEMGLGKTIQVVAFFEHLRKVQALPGPFLVIVPLSTLNQWEREIRQWTDMNVIVLTGNQKNRELTRYWEWFYLDENGAPKNKQIKFTALVTTYETMMHEKEYLSKIRWQVIVVDEAQRMKNDNSKFFQAMMEIRGYHRILLTGTPIQNNMHEIWSLLHFIHPDKFPSDEDFMAKYGHMEDESQVKEFKDMLHQYLLRRMKTDVEKSIPPKEETIIQVDMSVLQKQYYRALYERNREFLNKGIASTSNVPNLMNMIMQLRKVCNHPFLIKGVEEREFTPEQMADTEYYMNSLIRSSGKMVLLNKLLPYLKEAGHKVLIFSQLKLVLDIIEKYLSYKGYLYERLDGGIQANDRQSAIDRFCNEKYNRFVFLLSTRAGGMGINLTSADTVIIFDSDWNPQNDVQAQARCHRIGQKREVKVYRLLSRDTYEMFMFDRASKKLGLDQVILHDSNTARPTPSATPTSDKDETRIGLSKEEMMGMLKHGVYNVFNDENAENEASTFDEEDIVQILERRSERVVWQGDGQGSVFSKATFKMDGGEDVSVDDPNFWERVMPAASTSKMLLDELTRVISGSAADKKKWTEEKRVIFLSHLEGIVQDIERAFNEGKGMLLTDREQAKSVLLLCEQNQELFTAKDMTDMAAWLTKIDLSNKPRKTHRPSEVSTKPAARQSTAPDVIDEDDFAPPKKSRKKERKETPKRRGRRSRQFDSDSDFSDGEAKDEEASATESEFEEDNIPTISTEFAGKKTSSSRRGANTATSGRGPWLPVERRALQEAIFSLARPDWELLRTKAHLENRPLFEIQEISVEILKAISMHAKTDPEKDVFSRLIGLFASAKDTFEALQKKDEENAKGWFTPEPRVSLRKKGAVFKEYNVDIAFKNIEMTTEYEADLNELCFKRFGGWARRLALLEIVRNEYERCQKGGLPLLSNVFITQKLPALWWDPAVHDPDWLKGIYIYGWNSWEQLVRDESLSFHKIFKDKLDKMDNGEALTEATKDEKSKKQSFLNKMGFPTSKTLETHLKHITQALNKTRNAPEAKKIKIKIKKK